MRGITRAHTHIHTYAPYVCVPCGRKIQWKKYCFRFENTSIKCVVHSKTLPSKFSYVLIANWRFCMSSTYSCLFDTTATHKSKFIIFRKIAKCKNKSSEEKPSDGHKNQMFIFLLDSIRSYGPLLATFLFCDEIEMPLVFIVDLFWFYASRAKYKT